MKLTFIVNSIYYSESDFRKKVVGKLNIQDLEYQVLFTTHKGHASELAATALLDLPDRIIAVGGDGTLHEIINGCMISASDSLENLVVGLYPAGTGNDLARSFSMGKSITEFASRLLNNRSISLDIGILDFQNSHREFFVNEVSFGFGAEVIRYMEKKFQSNGFRKSYLQSILTSFLNYKPAAIRVRGDDFTWEGKSFITVISNARFMGGGLCLAPTASPSDGIFSITIIGEVTFWEFIRMLPLVMRGKRIRHRKIFYFQSTQIEIQSDSPDFAAETDGELCYKFPQRVSMLPGKLKFLE